MIAANCIKNDKAPRWYGRDPALLIEPDNLQASYEISSLALGVFQFLPGFCSFQISLACNHINSLLDNSAASKPTALASLTVAEGIIVALAIPFSNGVSTKGLVESVRI